MYSSVIKKTMQAHKDGMGRGLVSQNLPGDLVNELFCSKIIFQLKKKKFFRIETGVGQTNLSFFA